jgi:type I restriction enzyme R subunit
MSANAREKFAAYIPGGDLATYAKELPAQFRKSFTGAMALLRNPDFQDLRMNYERAPRTFLIAYETQDEVTSGWLVKGADGVEYKPEDYLTAFARFVRENPAHI